MLLVRLYRSAIDSRTFFACVFWWIPVGQSTWLAPPRVQASVPPMRGWDAATDTRTRGSGCQVQSQQGDIAQMPDCVCGGLVPARVIRIFFGSRRYFRIGKRSARLDSNAVFNAQFRRRLQLTYTGDYLS